MAYIGKSPIGSGVRTRYYYTATGGETSISGADDNGRTLSFTDAEYVDVYMNGVLLVHGTDYGTGTANTISSLAALSSGDIIEIIVYDIYTIAKINNEAARRRYYYTATGGETSISGADDNGQTITFAANSEIEVKVNGISIVQGSDFNTSAANTVGGLSPLTVGQVVEIVVYERFVLTDTVSKRDGGTFNNNIVVEGNITTTGIDDNATNTAITITENGEVLKPKNPAFRAYADTGWSSLGANNTWVKLPLNLTLFDNGNHWDAVNYYYVVPVTGIYSITACAYQDQVGKGRLAIYNGSTELIFTNVDYDGSGTTMHIAGLINLTAGDTISLQMRIPTSDSNDYFAAAQHTWIAGYLIG